MEFQSQAKNQFVRNSLKSTRRRPACRHRNNIKKTAVSVALFQTYLNESSFLLPGADSRSWEASMGPVHILKLK